MKYTGKIISLAFPETFVKCSDEPLAKALLAAGLGKKNYIKAGHAAFVLIDNRTGKAEYYDFGRYITPNGYGRVRSAITDIELEIPFKASLSKDTKLDNVEEFLLWLEANPHKTHGSGRLVASVCDYIDYNKAKEFVLAVQEKGSVPYKAFGKEGSNCSRIVADTILVSTDQVKIKRPLLRNKLFTPSPLGNVEKASLGNPIFQVEQGVMDFYPGSILKENLTNYFDKNIPETNVHDKGKVNVSIENAHFLHGIGSSAYFTLHESCEENVFVVKRYTECGKQDFSGSFIALSDGFDSAKKYKFVYDSNCKYCHVEQDGKKIRLESIKKVATNLMQRKQAV